MHIDISIVFASVLAEAGRQLLPVWRFALVRQQAKGGEVLVASAEMPPHCTSLLLECNCTVCPSSRSHHIRPLGVFLGL